MRKRLIGWLNRVHFDGRLVPVGGKFCLQLRSGYDPVYSHGVVGWLWVMIVQRIARAIRRAGY